jgi:uncharacterized protein (TIGR03083 family)
MELLASYVAAWRSCAADVEKLLRGLSVDDWDRPTDCPGWTVRDVAAHLAALEAELAGDPGPRLDQVSAATANVSGAYTQAGVEERRDRTPQQLVEEFSDAVRRRFEELEDNPPTDATGSPPRNPGGVGWDWQTLLRNRVIDLWVHEQDIRRAVDRPGDLDTPAARVTIGAFLAALPYVIAKRAEAAPGTTVVVVVDGRAAAFEMGSDGRCRAIEDVPEVATVRLELDAETLAVLGAGRRDPLTVDVVVEGDRELGERILYGLAVTT